METSELVKKGTAAWASAQTSQAREEGCERYRSAALERHKAMAISEIDSASSRGASEHLFKTPIINSDSMATDEIGRMIEGLGYTVEAQSFPRGRESGLAFLITWPPKPK